MVQWTRFWVTKIDHQMALLSAMLKCAKTINRWCLSHLQIRISWLLCSIWSLFDDWWWRRRRRRKTTYRPAAGFAAGKNDLVQKCTHDSFRNTQMGLIRGLKTTECRAIVLIHDCQSIWYELFHRCMQLIYNLTGDGQWPNFHCIKVGKGIEESNQFENSSISSSQSPLQWWREASSSLQSFPWWVNSWSLYYTGSWVKDLGIHKKKKSINQ